MRPNVGTVDAYLRIAFGLFAFGLGLKQRRRGRSLLYLALGANKVAEGITRLCPLLALLGTDTLSADEARRLEGGLPLPTGYGQLRQNPYLAPSSGGAPGEGNGHAGAPQNGPEPRSKLAKLRLRRREEPSFV